MKWATALYNMFVIGGCSYIVFWLGQSPWWFALALLLIVID